MLPLFLQKKRKPHKLQIFKYLQMCLMSCCSYLLKRKINHTKVVTFFSANIFSLAKIEKVSAHISGLFVFTSPFYDKKTKRKVCVTITNREILKLCCFFKLLAINLCNCS